MSKIYQNESHALSFADMRLYLLAMILVAGNIVLPQVAHLLPHGGPMWLPIYFFTLIGSCLFGWRLGLVTGLLSPVLNHLMFGMPSAAVLLPILIKSALLALTAGIVFSRNIKATVGALFGVVLTYQVAGTAIEWLLCGDFYAALADFRIGIPGLLFQVFGGYLTIKAAGKYLK